MPKRNHAEIAFTKEFVCKELHQHVTTPAADNLPYATRIRMQLTGCDTAFGVQHDEAPRLEHCLFFGCEFDGFEHDFIIP